MVDNHGAADGAVGREGPSSRRTGLIAAADAGSTGTLSDSGGIEDDEDEEVRMAAACNKSLRWTPQHCSKDFKGRKGEAAKTFKTFAGSKWFWSVSLSTTAPQMPS